ncbi:PBSX family phage terminase large subunit [Stenotrophomonas maltophilia]|uniref:PBSX family phage terminase large subunit n=2 Tax=Stenotrophomonas maltophilia TaxID=40324 RepID=UPI001AAFFC58|nr:PBSX family phage terminase large subunit [Stenotrophomonas maltophilia]MBO3002238.1 PBSX family phage terminase large subunit [Stenotrophomonas maltophilia]MBP1381618.1 PBSX family phage terminase large subunit [Stenotrophomonas maltophilia]MBP1386630.1 PBSX family phage terminase large subunit [Stenotrophomonas maltophilia]
MSELRLEVPAAMLPFWTEKRRHKIARGGRGSAKSWSIARMLATRGIIQPTRWLCCRETQKSIKESSLRLLADQIQSLNLGYYYDVQQQAIKGQPGTSAADSEFAFAGLKEHTADSIKSYEGFDGAWIEEAHSVSERSATVLNPTIRKPGSELWWSYNPEQEEDYVHQLAAMDDPDTLVITINWRDNPWFPLELEKERKKLQRINSDLYQHVWEGQCRSAAGLMFKRDWFQFYDVLPSRLNLYLASDYAVTPDGGDFTEHGVWGLASTGDLYAVDWWYGQTDPAEWIDAWIGLVGQHKPLAAFEEKGVILRAVESSITKRMREMQTFVRRVPLASAGSKAERALGFAARASAGTVYLPRLPWAVRLLNQLCAFNGEDGRQDDGVDVCSLIGRGLDSMANAAPEESGRQKRRMRDYDINHDEPDSWKTV